MINCQDFAILFARLARERGLTVRITINRRIAHVFNMVMYRGNWVAIEPQFLTPHGRGPGRESWMIKYRRPWNILRDGIWTDFYYDHRYNIPAGEWYYRWLGPLPINFPEGENDDQIF